MQIVVRILLSIVFDKEIWQNLPGSANLGKRPHKASSKMKKNV